jgi:serine/threonine protein kinase
LACLAQISCPPYSSIPILGSVYVGKDLRTGKEVALKVEHHEGSHSNLLREYEIYKDVAGCTGISKAYWYGKEGPYNVMVIDRYDLSLDVMVKQGGLSLHTVVSFASQMVSSCSNILYCA